MDDSALALLGVVSWPASISRRAAWRNLTAALPAAGVALRFVMREHALAPADAAASDVLKFPISPHDAETVGKLQLLRAFLQHAARAAPSDGALFARFVVHADDDAFVSPRLLALRLRRAPPAEDLVLGALDEWYMWDRASMMPTCLAYSPRRWELATRHAAGYAPDAWAARVRATADRAFRRPAGAFWNASDPELVPRHVMQCLLPGLAGPFPYAKGFFVALSRGVLRRLATRLDADDPKCGGEAHALAGRGGALLDPEKLHEHAPGHARHPASRILLEDVYHACLLHADFRASNLTLVHLRTSEWGATKRAPLRRADVYHKLRRASRFDHLRERAAELIERRERAAAAEGLACRSLADAMKPRGADAAAVPAWRWCEYKEEPR